VQIPHIRHLSEFGKLGNRAATKRPPGAADGKAAGSDAADVEAAAPPSRAAGELIAAFAAFALFPALAAMTSTHPTHVATGRVQREATSFRFPSRMKRCGSGTSRTASGRRYRRPQRRLGRRDKL